MQTGHTGANPLLKAARENPKKDGRLAIRPAKAAA